MMSLTNKYYLGLDNMKKIDLHIHTIVTSLDSKNGFVFDIEILEKYIKALKNRCNSNYKS